MAGRTGIGKTTLFKLILGLYAPRTGSIRICGLDPRAIPAEKRRPLCCCVEQEFTVIDGSVRDQITLRDARVTDSAVQEALALTGMAEVCAQLPQGLATPYCPALFSQGQHQLLGIARYRAESATIAARRDHRQPRCPDRAPDHPRPSGRLQRPRRPLHLPSPLRGQRREDHHLELNTKEAPCLRHSRKDREPLVLEWTSIRSRKLPSGSSCFHQVEQPGSRLLAEVRAVLIDEKTRYAHDLIRLTQ